MKKKIVIAKNIKDLIEKTFEEAGNIQVKYIIGKISPKVAAFVEGITGLKVEEYTHIVDSFAIKHVIGRHGNAKMEAKKGQLPVTLDYFDKIPEVLRNPDYIIDSGKNKSGRRVILYQKRINGTIIYIEEIRNNRKELAMNTMYIKKAH